MRFWDASAIVPLLVEQPASAALAELQRAGAPMAVWWGTPVECWSALARVRRDGLLDARQEEEAARMLEILSQAWLEVLPTPDVRAHARRVLRLHPLRAADALQLAAALVWAGSPPAGEMVVLDGRLAEAARLEGLSVLPGT